MSVLLDSLASGFDGDAARRAALDAALRDGLPGPRSEAWKYTPLRALERRSFVASAALPLIDPALLAGIAAPRLVFVNGRFDATHSDIGTLPAGLSLQPLSSSPERDRGGPVFQRADEVFARLNAVLADEGLVLRVEADAEIAAPISLVFAGAALDADSAWHLRHRIEIGANARATFVEHHLAAGDHAHLANHLFSIAIAANARLSHARVQQDAARATSFLRTDAVLDAGAEYRRLDLELGAGLSRHELNVRLEGDGAKLFANGVLLADGRRHVDTRLGIEHTARDTACDLLWRGIGSGRGRAVFHGGITIHAGADGSDANLSNKNLLLSENAEIDTQPVLEIHADEVKAAHGATVGRLDATAMFYLRSRGLPQAEARQLLTAAFCREPLNVIADPALHERLTVAMDNRLQGLAIA
ncbi:Fe-S cluster assembly protein SufD [Luteimonas sp. SX5]|uniref:Fe-S cluster assembly protein SufD n=1 Tax=Luteimonas galliterrae TaxID=2940486 RepID=A0ABT0MK29_9GAMM|nr:Fe-S cluster assembly protein SufD [Luteimonas galliterrae]MCL1635216.1 Fe-S cluster assembly protein SufD [Luteimonas galliterrae]